jgi:hypothetical protein
MLPPQSAEHLATLESLVGYVKRVGADGMTEGSRS